MVRTVTRVPDHQVEGRPFHAHKIILATASERFHHMLAGNFMESGMRVIELGDVDYTTFNVVRRGPVYMHECSWPDDGFHLLRITEHVG